MKSNPAFLLSFVLLALTCTSTNGLKCYECLYRKLGDTLDPATNASCAEGSSQGSKLLVECPNSAVVFGCFTISGKGKLNDGTDSEVMHRGCIATGPAMREECKTKGLQEWGEDATTDPLSSRVVMISAGFSPNTDFTGCYCTEDGCNGMDDGSSASENKLSTSLVAWIVTMFVISLR